MRFGIRHSAVRLAIDRESGLNEENFTDPAVLWTGARSKLSSENPV